MTPLALAQLAGKGVAAGGSLYGAWEKSRSLKSQAKAVERQAQATAEQGLWDQVRFNEDTRRLLSTQRALFGESGVRLEGSAADLMAATQTERVMDRMQLAKNTDYEVSSLMADAKELKRAAKSAKIGGVIDAFSSFF